MTRLLLSLVFVLPFAGRERRRSRTAPPPPPKHVPPKAAFDACAKAKVGDACTFRGRMDRTLTGTCETPRDNGKALVCRPDRHKGGGDGERQRRTRLHSGANGVATPAQGRVVILAAGGHHDRFSDRHRLFVRECLHVRASRFRRGRRRAHARRNGPACLHRRRLADRWRRFAHHLQRAVAGARRATRGPVRGWPRHRARYVDPIPRDSRRGRRPISGGRPELLRRADRTHASLAGAPRRRSVQARGDLLDAARADREADPRRRRHRDQGPSHRARSRARSQRHAAGPAPGCDHEQARSRAVRAQDEVRDRAARGRGSEATRGDQGEVGARTDRRRGRVREPEDHRASRRRRGADHGAGSRRCKAPRRAGDRRLRAHRPVGA